RRTHYPVSFSREPFYFLSVTLRLQPTTDFVSISLSCLPAVADRRVFITFSCQPFTCSPQLSIFSSRLFTFTFSHHPEPVERLVLNGSKFQNQMNPVRPTQ